MFLAFDLGACRFSSPVRNSNYIEVRSSDIFLQALKIIFLGLVFPPMSIVFENVTDLTFKLREMFSPLSSFLSLCCP